MLGWLLDRRLLGAAFVGYLLGVAYLVLWPQPDAPGYAVLVVAGWANSLGLVAVTAGHVEVALNVVLFVPLGGLGSLLWPRLPWWSWGAIGLTVSVVLEGLQAAFLPGRSPTVSDLVANTAGALLGALAAVPVSTQRARHGVRRREAEG